MPELTPSPPAWALGERQNAAALSEPAPHKLCRSGAAATQALAAPSAQGNPLLPPALSGDAGDRAGSQQVAHPIWLPSISQCTRGRFYSGDLPIPVSRCIYTAGSSVSTLDVLTSSALAGVRAPPAVPLPSGRRCVELPGQMCNEPPCPKLSIPIASRRHTRCTDRNTFVQANECLLMTISNLNELCHVNAVQQPSGIWQCNFPLGASSQKLYRAHWPPLSCQCNDNSSHFFNLLIKNDRSLHEIDKMPLN